MKSEFNLLFENILGQFGGEGLLSTTPVMPVTGEVEITVEEEMSELDIADELIKQIKGLRKIARENGFDSKIYYRARNIDKLAKKLKVKHGGSVDDSEEEEDDKEGPQDDGDIVVNPKGTGVMSGHGPQKH